MTIQGKLIDSSTGKPIGGALIAVYMTGDLSGVPQDGFYSGSDGSYVYTNGSLDTASNPTFATQADGYEQLIGNPEFFQGNVQIDPIGTVTNKIPSWVIPVVIALGVIAFIYFSKKYKLL